jgi:hypothetical protein
VQDFQNNILDVSGGLGLIVDAAGNTAGGPDGSGAGGSKPPLA